MTMHDLPHTHEVERIAATLIVTHRRRLHAAEVPEVRQVITHTQLAPVWVVDFYRDPQKKPPGGGAPQG